MAESRWFVTQEARPDSAVRLYALPHAGATAALYRDWCRQLPGTIEVSALALPGRGSRSGEPAARSLDALLAELGDALAKHCDRPYALFGHSMGALLAFELARFMRRRRLPAPTWMFVASAPAPDLMARSRARDPLHRLDDGELLEALHRLDGIPDRVRGERELMEALLPAVRADLELVETYRYAVEPPLACPLTVFGGASDRLVPRSALRAWRTYTTAAIALRVFPGGHFFLRDAAASLLAAIAGVLDAAASRAGRDVVEAET